MVTKIISSLVLVLFLGSDIFQCRRTIFNLLFSLCKGANKCGWYLDKYVCSCVECGVHPAAGGVAACGFDTVGSRGQVEHFLSTHLHGTFMCLPLYTITVAICKEYS